MNASSSTTVGHLNVNTGTRSFGTRTIGRRTFDFNRQVAVMAVVNRTPDSFSDQGATFVLDRAVEAALMAERAGADWVDIGGVPFGRSKPVTTEEEIERVIPVIKAVATASGIVISVDTNRPRVAEAAIAAGASVINDTSGLGDPEMASVIADSNAHVIITHSVGPAWVEKPAAYFDDVMASIRDFMDERLSLADKAGISREQIIIDPGHDLNKNTLHTLELTRRFNELTEFGLPVLAAVSNKDFIGESIDRPQGQRLAGSLASMIACIERGARIVRMHDIEPTVDAVRMIETILGMRPPVRVEHNAHPTRNV